MLKKQVFENYLKYNYNFFKQIFCIILEIYNIIKFTVVFRIIYY